MIKHLISLARLDKPIGILLLLWPTLWALWLASSGHPDQRMLAIFIFGVIVMRSAGCIINDIADRHVDKFVERTKNRPLASNQLHISIALMLFLFFISIAFLLVLQCNFFTIQLAFIGAALAIIYPFLKRITNLPQVGLGAAFAWGVPMAFAAVTNQIPASAWLLYAAAMLWPIIYDTMYAMTDREDDIKIGIKSSAILFGESDILIISVLQLVFLGLMFIVGLQFQLGIFYYLFLAGAGLLFLYQYNLIEHRDPKLCFSAFLNNNWVGLVIFIGIFLSDLL